MVAAVMLTGVAASVAGFAAAILSGYPPHHILLAYTLCGMIGALSLILVAASSTQDQPRRIRS